MKSWVAITGSSNGIGGALAEIFAREGHSIILHGRNQTDLQRMYEKITSYGVKADIVEGDLRSQKTLDVLLQKSEENNIDILINNVGYRCPGVTLNKITDEQIGDMFKLNLTVPIYLTRETYKRFLLKGRGCIINMNSIIGLEPRKNRTLYTASRFGLRGFTESLRLEAKENNIRIISIYPARVRTKPEFEYGWGVFDAAEKMYEIYAAGAPDDLILDYIKDPLSKPRSYPISGKIYSLNQ